MAERRRGPVPGTPEAKHGGNAILAKYGPEFYREIGKKGGAAVRDRAAVDFAEIGKKGGNKTMERHGTAHYERIGVVGGSRSKRDPEAPR